MDGSKSGPSTDGIETQDVRNVLVVDDSKLQRRILSSSLARWGFYVSEAGSGAEALAHCRETAPDIVLSDWMMPGMDGLEFCRAFRDIPRDQYGYFILLTSKAEKEAVARGLDCGADDFLNKPVNSAELRARINAGARLLRAQRDLKDKNRLLSDTLDQLQTLYDALDRDLVEARKLQQSLLRERQRTFGPARVSLMLQSSGHVGGDLVGVYPINDTHFGLFAIDVSGHGISSALMTARLAGYLSSAAPEHNIAMRKTSGGRYVPRPPARAVEMLNRMVLDEMATEHYFTLLLADIDTRDGTVRFAQAGHPHPVIQRRDGRVEPAGTGGLPVGLIPGATFEQSQITLGPGERMLIQSDGITECAAPDGSLLNDEGLMDMLAGMRGTSGNDLLAAIMTRLSDYSGHTELTDDISAVLLEF